MIGLRSPINAITMAVVGARFPNEDGTDRRTAIAACNRGDPVALRPEPENRHDAGAIAVFGPAGAQLGYLPAERCRRIGRFLEEGREIRAVFQAPADFGALIRLAFDGADPVLPPELAAPADPCDPADAASGFYPDPEWPDE